MTNLTLKQLRYFEALARHGHFGRAAEAVAISQPALSMQIRDLEAELGTDLIERGTRQVQLTAFGEEFAARARDILRSVDELGGMARAQAGRLTGRLRLGVIPTVAPYLLPAIIGRISLNHPEVEIHVRETLTSRLVVELSEGRLDAAIVALPISEPAFQEMPLFDEHFVLVRPRGEADKPVPSREKLKEMRLLLLEEGHCFRDQALSFCQLRSALPRELLDGSSLSTLVQMVGAGMGVTLIPDMAVDIETRSAEVAISRFGAPEPVRRIGMIWRKTSPLARHLPGIAELVRDARPASALAA